MENEYYYLIYRNGSYSGIKLLYEANRYDAEKSMMTAFGIDRSDIQQEVGGCKPSWANVYPCAVYDARLHR